MNARILLILLLCLTIAACVPKKRTADPGAGDDQLVETYLEKDKKKAGPDFDKDGVGDSRDECPRTPPEVIVDAFGCAVPLYLMVRVDLNDWNPGELVKLAALMRDNPESTLTVAAHTDNKGAPAQNKAYSEKRSVQIKDILVKQHKIPAERIIAVGYGDTRPMVPNATAAGRKRNKRIELILKGFYHRKLSEQTLLYAPPPLERAKHQSTPLAMSSPAPQRFEPTHIRFATGASALSSYYRDQLESIGARLAANPKLRARIEGYTDSRGSQANNLALSTKRAKSVKQALINTFGIDPGRLTAQGFGEKAPLADNATKQGRRLNRRVSVLLFDPGATTLTAPPQLAETSLPKPPAATTQKQTARKSRLPEDPLPFSHTLRTAVDKDGDYAIRVSVKKCKLWLYKRIAPGKLKLVKTYSVATPSPKRSPILGHGVVTEIDFNPWWTPTPNIRKAAKRKGKRLPRSVRPGSPANPMGAFKIHLSHAAAMRIHGTNQPHLIGRRVSFGCIRMHNKEGKNLARIIKVGTPVSIEW